MNWQKVEALLKNCSKGSAYTGEAPGNIPAPYLEFLSRFDGAEGFVGAEQYLALWAASQVAELNVAYSVAKYLPGVVLIGTDGADTGFGIDRNGRFVAMPLVGMSAAGRVDLGGDFESFLERLAFPNGASS